MTLEGRCHCGACTVRLPRTPENVTQCNCSLCRATGFRGVGALDPRQDVTVEVTRADGSAFHFIARCRIDTYNELEYFRSGGILHYVLRRLAS